MNYSTKTLEQLTRARGATLHRMLRRAGIKGHQGKRREIGLQDCCTVALTMELAARGLDWGSAAAIATAVPPGIWPETVETEDRWLFATRGEGDDWTVVVCDRQGIARRLMAADVAAFHVVVGLPLIVQRVFEAAAVQDTGHAGHA